MQQWNKATLSKLAKKYIQGTATKAEVKELLQWYHAFDETDLTVIVPAESEEEEATTEARMRQRLQEVIQTPSIAPVRRNAWQNYAVAAVVLALIAATAFYITKNIKPATLPSKGTTAGKPAIQPGGNKATLTLADGHVIVLDTANNGTIGNQNGTVIQLTNGQLSYQPHALPEQVHFVTAYNTITTPKGGQYQVVLPDGTIVWLNAASSLRFPSTFRDKVREVTLSGEACFEVAADANMPFIVKANNMQVNVLGTLFNIMAYADEPATQATLISGKVSIHASNSTTPDAIMKPGQQAQLPFVGNLQLVNDVDVEDVLAWKNGKFRFLEADIKAVLRQIGRWYDIEVAYAGLPPNEKFTGEIPRNCSIEEVITILKLSNIHFTINNRTMIVTR